MAAAAEAVEQRASLTGGAKDGDQAALLGGAGFAMEMGMKVRSVPRVGQFRMSGSPIRIYT
eukprot:1154748-Pelagomonas_calceolata.AAC.1